MLWQVAKYFLFSTERVADLLKTMSKGAIGRYISYQQVHQIGKYLI